MSEVKTKGTRSLQLTLQNRIQKKHVRLLVPLEVTEHLSISEEFPEVYVEQMSGSLEHDVVVVSVADA